MPGLATPRTDLPAGDLRLLHDIAVLQLVMDYEREPARKHGENRTIATGYSSRLSPAELPLGPLRAERHLFAAIGEVGATA